jgi:hypothetical protein
MFSQHHSPITPAVAVLLLFACSFGCGNSPSVRVSTWGGTAKIDVATLGEYPTTITRIRLQNQQSHAVVWEVKALSGTPQIHGLILKKGVNPVSLAGADAGTYAIVSPLNSKIFQLDSGVIYTLELWNSASGGPAKVSIQFAK